MIVAIQSALLLNYLFVFVCVCVCRVAAEEKLAQAVSNLEKAASANSTELLGVQEQLVAQKQLASKYSDRVRIYNP